MTRPKLVDASQLADRELIGTSHRGGHCRPLRARPRPGCWPTCSVTATVGRCSEDADVEVVELRPLAHAITDALLTGFPAGELAAAVEAVAQADAVIAVTPVFSASYSGLFKTFFDVLEPGPSRASPCWSPRPPAPRGTRSCSSTRSGRCSATCTRSSCRTAVFAASEDWAAAGVDGRLRARIDRAAAELAALGRGRSPPRRPVRPSVDKDIADLLGDFESLLGHLTARRPSASPSQPPVSAALSPPRCAQVARASPRSGRRCG